MLTWTPLLLNSDATGVGVAPNAPTDVVITTDEVDQITFSWIDSTVGTPAPTYAIYTEGLALVQNSVTSPVTIPASNPELEVTGQSYFIQAQNFEGTADSLEVLGEYYTNPNEPTNFDATDDEVEQITFSWTNSTEANPPEITYRVYNDHSGTVIDNATSPVTVPSSNSNIIAGPYLYYVMASNGINPPAYSLEDSGEYSVLGVAPDAPTNVVISTTEVDQITFSWTNSTVGTPTPTYDIYTEGLALVQLDVTSPVTIPASNPQLQVTDQLYFIRAINSEGTASSLEVLGEYYTAVDAPTLFDASDNKVEEVEFTWTDSTKGNPVPMYRVYNDHSGIVVDDVTSPVTVPSSNSNIIDGPYLYQVMAYNGVGSPAYSNEDLGDYADATIAPNSPTNFVATNDEVEQITFTWTDSTVGTPTPTYDIYYDTSTLLVSGVTSPHIEPVASGALETYFVRAVNSEGTADSNTNEGESVAEGDITPPVITLIGSATVKAAKYHPYTELGATALDDTDGDITGDIVIGGDTVNINVNGDYTVTYNVSDAAGNPAIEVTRVVSVVSARVSMTATALTEPEYGEVIGGTFTYDDNGDGTWHIWTDDVITHFEEDAPAGDTSAITTLVVNHIYDLTDLRFTFALDNATHIDVSGTDVTDVTDATATFIYASKIVNLDLSSWDTSGFLNFQGMFANCILLECISDIDTTGATNKTDMFLNTPLLANPSPTIQADLVDGNGAVYVGTGCPPASLAAPIYLMTEVLVQPDPVDGYQYLVNSSESGEIYNGRLEHSNLSNDEVEGTPWWPSNALYPDDPPPADGWIDLDVNGTATRQINTQWTPPLDSEWVFSGIYDLVVGVSFKMYSLHYKGNSNLLDIYLGENVGGVETPVALVYEDVPYTPPQVVWIIQSTPPEIIYDFNIVYNMDSFSQVVPSVTNIVYNMDSFSNDNVATAGVEQYTNDNWFWMYDQQPTLLLGGSSNDNLFQETGTALTNELDTIAACGGNYIRNTMSDRNIGDIYAFLEVSSGTYDLDQWNDTYWTQFETLLTECQNRGIVVQIELFDRFDYSEEHWDINPWSPDNNVNYTNATSGFDDSYPLHPSNNVQPFFYTIPEISTALITPSQQAVILPYQQQYMDKVLSISLQYDNVLYCMDNETGGDPIWSAYWADYVKDAAALLGKTVDRTEMWGDWDNTETWDNIPNTYTYTDISQNNHEEGDVHWNNVAFAKNAQTIPVPVNNVKIYGFNHSTFLYTEEATQRFFSSIFGGCASARFHRDDGTNYYGLGIQPEAQNLISIARAIDVRTPWINRVPDVNHTLLSSRSTNEAYLSYEAGSAYVLYFYKERGSSVAGSVGLDLTGESGTFTLQWTRIQDGTVSAETSVTAGSVVTMTEPAVSDYGYIAVLTKD